MPSWTPLTNHWYVGFVTPSINVAVNVKALSWQILYDEHDIVIGDTIKDLTVTPKEASAPFPYSLCPFNFIKPELACKGKSKKIFNNSWFVF